MVGKQERQHLKTLERRRNHLLERIQVGDGQRGGAFDKAEAAALTWALYELTEGEDE